MARAIWSGSISFGMVSIPVGLFTATQSKDLSFNQLNRKTMSRIKYQKVDAQNDEVVSPEDIVRGYEVSKGSYVIMDEADFEDLPVPSKKTITVDAFVKSEQVDPIYYDATYFLEPDEIGKKPYALLHKALKEKGVNAVAKIAVRNKESLCLIRPTDKGLLLETLYFPDEIRAEPEVGVDDVKVDSKELGMATSLVDLLYEDFDPSKYKDMYREKLLERIEAKVAGAEIQHVAEPAGPAQVVDLMEALRQSLEAAKLKKAS
jgi:DNA end-binding protein Ku